MTDNMLAYMWSLNSSTYFYPKPGHLSKFNSFFFMEHSQLKSKLVHHICSSILLPFQEERRLCNICWCMVNIQSKLEPLTQEKTRLHEILQSWYMCIAYVWYSGEVSAKSVGSNWIPNHLCNSNCITLLSEWMNRTVF